MGWHPIYLSLSGERILTLNFVGTVFDTPNHPFKKIPRPHQPHYTKTPNYDSLPFVTRVAIRTAWEKHNALPPYSFSGGHRVRMHDAVDYMRENPTVPLVAFTMRDGTMMHVRPHKEKIRQWLIEELRLFAISHCPECQFPITLTPEMKCNECGSRLMKGYNVPKSSS